MKETPSALRTAGVVALASLLGTASSAQQPPTFRSDAQVVVLDVVARDGRGHTVGDLRSDEIEVFEDGQRCEIQSFRLVRAGSSTPTSAPAAAPRPAREVESAAADPGSPSRANLVVLVFDTIPVANAALARQGATDLLKLRFPANTWFAVYKIDRSMRMLQPFTSDPARLETAVRAATTRRVAELAKTWPGLAVLDEGARLRVVIPERYRVGHEAHFAEVTERFLAYLKDRTTLPAWERANMLAKYKVTTEAVALSRR